MSAHDDARMFNLAFLTGRFVLAKVPWFDTPRVGKLLKPLDTSGATITGNGQTGSLMVIAGLSLAASGETKVSDILAFPNGAMGRVQIVTKSNGQDTLTVQSVNSSNLVATAGQALGVGSNAQSEAATGTDHRRRLLSYMRNVIQIQNQSIGQTDIQKSSLVEVETNGQPAMILQEEINMAYRMMAGLGQQWIAGQPGGSSFSQANPDLAGTNGMAVQTSRGLYNYIITGGGVNDSVSVANTVTELGSARLH